MARVDPLALDPEGVSLHQLATFVAGSDLLAEALAHSPLFTLAREGSVARAEWIATAPEEPVPYPLGRVTLHARGILLEGFAESRIAELRRHLDPLGPLRISADETRAFRLEELLREPARAFHPVEEGSPVSPTVRDVARWYLRAGWTYQPCPELDDRPPYVVAQTGRGQKRIAALIDGLAPKLRERYRDFPDFPAEELRALLLPLPAPAPPPEVRRPRVSRAPRRS
jgi:hypothetical protein